MPDVFPVAPGTVVAIDSPNGLPAMDLFLTGWQAPGTAGGFNAMLTSIAVVRQGVVQFAHSLDDFVHVYLFGERMGQLTLSGIAFSRLCGGSGPVDGKPQTHGIEDVLAYFDEYQAVRTGAPVVVVLGLETAFRAFIVGVQGGITDPERGLGQFALQMVVVPPRRAR